MIAGTPTTTSTEVHEGALTQRILDLENTVKGLQTRFNVLEQKLTPPDRPLSGDELVEYGR